VGFEKIPTADVLSPSVATARVPRELVHLVKERVFAQFGEEDEMVNSARWVVDTGITNHITGACSTFSVLYTDVCGTVKFGVGSVVCIGGCRTIIFSCKSGEHRSFSGIYYIPTLKMNIFSVAKLDEAGYEIPIKSSVMSIRDEEDRLMAKITHAPNWLYVLNTTVTQPDCLVARGKVDSWRWHARLGHLNLKQLRNMASQEWVRGVTPTFCE
jgi:hypothetical protein